MPDDFVIEGYASAAEIAAMKDTPSTEQPGTPSAEQPVQQPATPQAETATVEKPVDVQQPAQQQPAQQQQREAVDFWPQVTPQAFAERYKDKRADVLKAFGLNDFLVDAINYYDRTGNLQEYAEVKSVDYNKMPDDEIIRKNLRQEFAHLDLTPEEMEMLYDTRITHRFKTDADQFSEKEVKVGKMEMKLEADRLRRQYIENQKKFVAPEIAKQEQPDPQVQMQEMQQHINSLPEVKQFVTEKKLVLGAGDRAYNYEFANPQELLDIMMNGESYQRNLMLKDETGKTVLDTKGQPVLNYKKLMKAAAVIRDDAEYDKLLINHGISLGKKEVIDGVEHPETPKQGGSGEPDTIWQALKHAKVT